MLCCKDRALRHNFNPFFKLSGFVHQVNEEVNVLEKPFFLAGRVIHPANVVNVVDDQRIVLIILTEKWRLNVLVLERIAVKLIIFDSHEQVKLHFSMDNVFSYFLDLKQLKRKHFLLVFVEDFGFLTYFLQFVAVAMQVLIPIV